MSGALLLYPCYINNSNKATEAIRNSACNDTTGNLCLIARRDYTVQLQIQDFPFGGVPTRGWGAYENKRIGSSWGEPTGGALWIRHCSGGIQG